MTRTRKWSPLAVLGAVAIVFTACGGSASPNPSTPAASTGATAAPPSQAASQAAYDGMVYPETGEAPCGTAPYTGQLKKITAVDALTVEFQLCGPAVDFLPKIAFSAFGIHDSDYLTAHGTDGSLLDKPNGTGPYTLKEWSRGNRMVFSAFDGYWGTKALTPNLEYQWSDDAASRLLALQAGTVDGIDNPGTDDIKTIQGDSTLQYKARAGLNVSFLGMNNTVKPWDNEKVRQAIAKGINRKQIVDNFYPAGSTAADYFTPCEIPFACEGDKQWDFDPAGAKALLAEAGFPNGFDTKIHFRAAVRGYVTDPPLIATEICAAAEGQPGHQRRARAARVGGHARRLRRRHPARPDDGRLGRGLSGSVQLPRLPLRLRLRQEVRDPVPGHRRGPQQGRRDRRSGGPHRGLHHGQQPDQAARPRVLHGSRRLGRRLQGRRRECLRVGLRRGALREDEGR